MTGKSVETWNPQDLKDLREKHGITQEALAKMMDVTTNYISMLERGIKRPGKIFKNYLERVKSDLNGERLNHGE